MIVAVAAVGVAIPQFAAVAESTFVHSVVLHSAGHKRNFVVAADLDYSSGIVVAVAECTVVGQVPLLHRKEDLEASSRTADYTAFVAAVAAVPERKSAR